MPLLGIGVGTPGVIDTQAGVICWAVNLDWQDLPLAKLLTERYRLPANVANDSQAAALGEYAFGEGGRTANLVAIKVGRGVGAGIVLGGQLFQGDSHGAGEIGHIFMVDDGAACRCGRFGCLETVTSAPAIVREARALAVGTPGSLLHRASLRQDDLTLDDVRAAFEAGDPVACAIVLRGRPVSRPSGRGAHRYARRAPRRPARECCRVRRAVARRRAGRGNPAGTAAPVQPDGPRHRQHLVRRRAPRRVRDAHDERTRPEPGAMSGTETLDHDLLAGVDVGGSTIKVLLADASLAVAGRFTAPTLPNDPEHAGEQVVSVIREACRVAGVDTGRIGGIGVGVPGRVDSDAGRVSLALNLGWHDVELRRDLESLMGVETFVANDVRAAALGLVERRVFGDIDSLVYISIGTGISAGIVLHGRLQTGRRSLAGEVGHVVVLPEGPCCPCGLRGCLETVAAGPALARRVRTALSLGCRSELSGVELLTAVEVYEAACRGDPVAVSVTEDAGRHIARLIYDLALALDPAVVCLGGGVASAGAPFIQPIERELERLRASSRLAAEVLPGDLVNVLPPGADAGTWGAVLLARKGRTGRSVRGSVGKEVGERPLASPLTT